VNTAIGEVILLPPFDDPSMLEGLDGFSHIWLVFQFHHCTEQGWRRRVRPPRLGGNREVGVWASRSPFRPNFIGLSAVRLLQVVVDGGPLLRVAGLDLVDGTPIFDIKPYVPYADCLPGATGGFAAEPPPATQKVRFSADAESRLAEIDDGQALRELVIEVLRLDPRPAYRRGVEAERVYGMNLAGYDIRWMVGESGTLVIDVIDRADSA
jgi:tRNA-Thr(GGU) m(6)t(6)A37 methyltransferase TsaA